MTAGRKSDRRPLLASRGRRCGPIDERTDHGRATIDSVDDITGGTAQAPVHLHTYWNAVRHERVGSEFTAYRGVDARPLNMLSGSLAAV